MQQDLVLMKILLNSVLVGPVDSVEDPLFKTQTRWKTFSAQSKLTLINRFSKAGVENSANVHWKRLK